MTKRLILILYLLTVLSQCQSAELSPGAVCTADSECPKFYLCQGTTKKVCTHKPLLPSSTALEIGGALISVIINAIGTAGGVGAGGFVVPYLTLMNNFTPNNAILVTYAIVCGGGVASLANIKPKKNPATNRPFICYNILMLCVPCLFAGVPIGVILNRVLAPVVIYVLICCILIYFTLKNSQKFWMHYKKERKSAGKGNKAKSSANPQPTGIAIEIKAESNPTKNPSLPNEKAQDTVTTEEGQPQQELPKRTNTQSTVDERESVQKEGSRKNTEKKDVPHLPLNAMGPGVKSGQATASTQNYLPVPKGDNSQEENELYELQFSSILSLMLVDDPEKIIADAREREQKQSLERNKVVQTDLKAQDIEAHPGDVKKEEVAPTQAPHLQKEHKKLFKREYRCFPIQKIWVPALSLVVVVVMNLIIGKYKLHSIANVAYCSPTYWGLYGLMICMQLSLFFIALGLQFKWQKHKDQNGWEYLPEDVRLTPRRALAIFLVCFGAGILAGAVAVGGTSFIAPLMLSYGVPPQPLAATTAILIVCSQFSSLFAITSSHMFNSLELVFLLLVAASISYPISRAAKWFVKKTQRQSVILAILLFIIASSFIMNITSMGVSLASDKTFMTTFHSYC